jgi:hypothetical protein
MGGLCYDCSTGRPHSLDLARRTAPPVRIYRVPPEPEPTQAPVPPATMAEPTPASVDGELTQVQRLVAVTFHPVMVEADTLRRHPKSVTVYLQLSEARDLQRLLTEALR